ncbi:DUF5694 domain-containing protein [Pontibacter sp. G13]|uniref:DUF5694 domain-containing protein n=1 Tax=Pontibacter sp. G13 TaxID=3074898 RepID=UPI00288B3507|nr:DUF5694 domain-containing protein [Pontibacter sp. G13]WNJ16258.1 DUF5694 domain-containing protein [Pontibacter sp. G13]
MKEFGLAMLALLLMVFSPEMIAQSPPCSSSGKVKVMLLGADMLPDDLLAPNRQSEWDHLVQGLERFHPDQVLFPIVGGDLEDTLMNRAYTRYVRGYQPLSRSLVAQLGYRLAFASHLDRIDGYELSETMIPTLDQQVSPNLNILSLKHKMANKNSLTNYFRFLNDPKVVAAERRDLNAWAMSHPDPQVSKYMGALTSSHLATMREILQSVDADSKAVLVLVDASSLSFLIPLMDSMHEIERVDPMAYLQVQ